MAQFTYWDVGGCGCAGDRLYVRGCGPFYPGVSVAVASGGVTVASGTTDGTGSIPIPSLSGNYDVTVTGQSARFDAFSATELFVAGTDQLAQLAPAAGYRCLEVSFGCLEPTTETLNISVTNSGGGSGSGTLIWTGSEWDGTALVLGLQWTFAGGALEGNSPAFGAFFASLISMTCPPGFTSQWTMIGPTGVVYAITLGE